MESKASNGNGRYLVGIGILIALILTTMFFVLSAITAHPAHAHDYKQPRLDGWYEGLMRPHTQGYFGGGTSCCSKLDCHTTEAEHRGEEWWARVGKPIERPDGGRDWQLVDWVKIPKEAIVPGRNEAGEAVICHPTVWKAVASGDTDGIIDAEHTPVFCFVPPNEI